MGPTNEEILAWFNLVNLAIARFFPRDAQITRDMIVHAMSRYEHHQGNRELSAELRAVPNCKPMTRLSIGSTDIHIMQPQELVMSQPTLQRHKALVSLSSLPPLKCHNTAKSSTCRTRAQLYLMEMTNPDLSNANKDLSL